jgi:hypothetical protein
MSLTHRSEEASKLKMARRLGSAMMANVDSIPRIYQYAYIPVKEYKNQEIAVLRPLIRGDLE